MSRRIKRNETNRASYAAVPGIPKEIKNVMVDSPENEGNHFSNTVKNILARTLEKSRQKLRYMEVEHDISKLSMNLNLGEYTFSDEMPLEADRLGGTDPLVLDVTALDRYNEDIRYYRASIIEECRRIPEEKEPSSHIFKKLAHSITSLCRGAYFGTHKAQELAGGTIPLLVWILNKPHLTRRLHLIIIRCLGELLYNSPELKYEFAESQGIKMLCKFLRHIPSYPLHSQMAAYVLAMAAIGSAEIIEEACKQTDIEEVVGEMTFEYYWLDWPVNYGVILQGLLFGPHSVSPNQELFQFM